MNTFLISIHRKEYRLDGSAGEWTEEYLVIADNPGAAANQLIKMVGFVVDEERGDTITRVTPGFPIRVSTDLPL